MSSLFQDEGLFSEGLEKLGFIDSKEPLMDYLKLLDKWNKTYNLTAIRDLSEMAIRHILDSLAISPWLRGNSILDIGTGPGLPGIPLAISHPHLKFTLLDSNGKKTRFLDEVKRRLQLNNVEVVQSRAENYQPSLDFDTLTSRAFSDVKQMLHWTKHLASSHSIWLAMKGRYPETELDSLTFPYQVEEYKVPGLDGERCCIIIENKMKE